jgi:hypothetical protein
MTLTRQEIESLLRGEKTKRLATEGFTTAELGEMLGASTAVATKHVNRGIQDGLFEYAGRKAFQRMDGAMSNKPAYRLTEVKR